ncbi:MAG TPA: phosphoacceptor domain-containing protein, partial [Cyanobacteria bacterium UBA8803]|nr:phosphoacceptor domain-containing protein [Cyanobacteria bacterium UBA8803]
MADNNKFIKTQLFIQPSQLERQVQQLNAYLEYCQLHKRLNQLQQQNLQLQQALKFEAILNRIGDRLHHSLDESQILQTTVLELTKALGAKGCYGALVDLQENSASIRYAYSCGMPGYQDLVIDRDSDPKINEGLKQGQSFQFCSLIPNTTGSRVAQFACPIMEESPPHPPT